MREIGASNPHVTSDLSTSTPLTSSSPFLTFRVCLLPLHLHSYVSEFKTARLACSHATAAAVRDSLRRTWVWAAIVRNEIRFRLLTSIRQPPLDFCHVQEGEGSVQISQG